MPVDLQKTVVAWRASLCEKVELAALISRNPTAHKWKVTYRSIVLRELVSWRLVELLEQTALLLNQGHTLGAVVLVRSAFETLSVLIYLNEKTAAVVGEGASFFDYCETTSRLMLGSKDKSTPQSAININTVLERCEKKYPGIVQLYADFSESVHPNYDGVCSGFSRIDEQNYVTSFLSRWDEKYRQRLPVAIELCVHVFQHEYNDVWPQSFEKLEGWLVENDAWLEANKPSRDG
jgi:hypothetical protein